MNDLVKPQCIGGALRHAAEVHQSAVAYIDRGDRYSFQQVDTTTDHIASGLLELGLSRGDRLAIVGLNQIEWLQLFYAAARIGVAVVAMSVRHRDTEFQTMLGDSGVRAIATLRQFDGFDFVNLIDKLRSNLPNLQHIIGFDGAGPGVVDWATLANTPVDHEKLKAAQSTVNADDLAMVIYTSGTTGRPKGAALTHRTMLATASSQAAHINAASTDMLQLAMPFNHVGGITCGVLTMLLGGGTCELVPAFKAETVLTMMAKNPPTIVIGVPTMLTLLLMSLETVPVNLGSVRLVITGGSNADSTLLTKLRDKLPKAAVMNLYGLSESSGALVMTPWDASSQELIESIGRPLPGAQMRIVDSDDKDVAPDTVGELLFRGLGVVASYVGGAVPAESFASGGWLRTGDLAYADSRGLVHLRGRKKEMYIQGGFNIYPVEVEGFIAKHPKVMMVAGIGVPDPVLGEIGRYYVVPKPGSDLTEQEIREHCSQHLADYKVPRQIVIRTNLPMTPTGKIQKAALREET
jgi:fatty-acyl-CoA synthase